MTTWTNASPDEAWLVGFDDGYRGTCSDLPDDPCGLLNAEYFLGYFAGRQRAERDAAKLREEERSNK